MRAKEKIRMARIADNVKTAMARLPGYTQWRQQHNATTENWISNPSPFFAALGAMEALRVYKGGVLMKTYVGRRYVSPPYPKYNTDDVHRSVVVTVCVDWTDDSIVLLMGDEPGIVIEHFDYGPETAMVRWVTECLDDSSVGKAKCMAKYIQVISSFEEERRCEDEQSTGE